MNVKLVGNFIQHIEAELMYGEEFYAQKGTLIYLEQGIEKDVVLNGGGNGTLGTIGNLLGANLQENLSSSSVTLISAINLVKSLSVEVLGCIQLRYKTNP